MYIPPTGGRQRVAGMEEKKNIKNNLRFYLMDTDCWDQFTPSEAISVVGLVGRVVLIAAIHLASAAAAARPDFVKIFGEWIVNNPHFYRSSPCSSSSYPPNTQSCWFIMLHQPPAGHAMGQMCLWWRTTGAIHWFVYVVWCHIQKEVNAFFFHLGKVKPLE